MKKLLLVAAMIAAFFVPAFSQVTNAKISAAMAKFPGTERSEMEALLTAKIAVGIALPTWLPAEFTLERIRSRIGRRVSLDDREFIVIYSRTLKNGKLQRFALEVGFDGLGGLPYDVTNELITPVGRIDLMYEPKDPDNEGARIKNFAMTEWFKVGKTDIHFNGRYGDPEGDDPNLAMISLADTLKILRSLNRL